MKRKKYYLVIIFALFFFNCSKQKDDNSITISLTKKKGGSLVEFDVINYSSFPLISYMKKHPKYYLDNLDQFKGIPELDSFQIVTFNTQNLPFKYDLYKKGYISKKSLINRNFNPNDTIGMLKDFHQYQINAVSGFLKNKQIVILDSNADKDFDNEKRFEFSLNFGRSLHENPKLINSIEPSKLYYQNIYQNKITTTTRDAKLYPYTNSVFNYLINMNIIDERLDKYTLILELNDFYTGSFTYDNLNYKIEAQGINQEQSIFYIFPDSLSFTDTDQTFQHNFSYKEKDTIKINSQNFIISLNSNFDSITLYEIKDTNKKFNSRMGYNIDNQKLVNLKRDTVDLYGIINQKKYTLIDFWGTWCTPCKKLTPKLKQMNNEYSNDLNMVGVALDRNINDVLNYTKNNQMNWNQYYVDYEERPNNSIIKRLKINSYPTYILLDREGKIILRGGSLSLKKIDNYLKKGINK